MRKTRDLFKKTRDIKGTFHLKTDTIKNRNSKYLRKEKRLKRWQKYTEELYQKKDLNDLDNHDSMATDVNRARYTGVSSQVGLRKHY